MKERAAGKLTLEPSVLLTETEIKESPIKRGTGRIKPRPIKLPTYERKRPKESSAPKRQELKNPAGSVSRSGSSPARQQNLAMSSGFRFMKGT